MVFSYQPEFTIEGAPECGLYFHMPEDYQLQKMMVQLRKTFYHIAQSPYEKNMHLLGFTPPKEFSGDILNLALPIASLCQEKGIVFLLHSHFDLCEIVEADGILLPYTERNNIATYRKKLGDDVIIGISAPADQKLLIPMLLEPIDYLYLPQLTADEAFAIDWWKTKTDIPVGVCSHNEQSVYTPYVESGVDFLALDGNFWQDNKKLDVAITELTSNIETIVANKVMH